MSQNKNPAGKARKGSKRPKTAVSLGKNAKTFSSKAPLVKAFLELVKPRLPLEIVDDLDGGKIKVMVDPSPARGEFSPHRNGPAFGPDDSVRDLIAKRAQYRETAAYFMWGRVDEALENAGLLPTKEVRGQIREIIRYCLVTFEANLLEINARIKAKARMAPTAGKVRSHAQARAVFNAVLPLVRRDKLSLEEAARVLADRGKKKSAKKSGPGRPKTGRALSSGRINTLVLEERRRRVLAKVIELTAGDHGDDDDDVHVDEVSVQIEAWSVSEPTMIPVTRATAANDILTAVKKWRENPAYEKQTPPNRARGN
jgi:hypothetical protein